MNFRRLNLWYVIIIVIGEMWLTVITTCICTCGTQQECTDHVYNPVISLSNSTKDILACYQFSGSTLKSMTELFAKDYLPVFFIFVPSLLFSLSNENLHPSSVQSSIKLFVEFKWMYKRVYIHCMVYGVQGTHFLKIFCSVSLYHHSEFLNFYALKLKLNFTLNETILDT